VSSSKSGAVIHRQLAVIACDVSGTLKETLARLAGLEIDLVCVSDRHLVLPASQVKAVLSCLNQHGQFPRLVGDENTLLETSEPISDEQDEAGEDAK
jgi:putative heme iron utilization protein